MRSILHLVCLATANLFILQACESTTEPTDEGTVFEVDCIGMALESPLNHVRYVTTRFSNRCVGIVSDTTWGGDLELWADGASLGTQNGMALTVNYAGHTYVARAGNIHMEWDPNDEHYATGSYDVTAYDEDGEQVTLRGSMEWCDFAKSTLCPYQADNFGLEQEVLFSAPDGYTADPGTYASECRVLIDEEREAVQVDMQLGVFEGTNVAMNWLQCGFLNSGAYGAPHDEFTFRAAGVPGPGTYDYVTQDVANPTDPMAGRLGLPGFRLYVPRLYFGWTCLLHHDALLVNDHATGASFVDPYLADPTSCSFTIAENPGRFELDCENVRKYARPGQGAPTVGEFHLEADCDVRYTTP